MKTKINKKNLTSMLACTLVFVLGAGCRAFQSPRQVTQDKTDQIVVDPAEVQQQLMRFSDEYLMGMLSGMNQLRHGTRALDPADLLNLKIGLVTEICSIASGPNAIANLLDMNIFIAVMRRSLEDYWQPKVFGESAQSMLDSCRNAETNIGLLTNQLLTPAQQAEWRTVMDAWFLENPRTESLIAARAVGFAARVTEESPDEKTGPRSVFGLLMLDPLASLDPATREIAHMRLMAERAFYVSQKMPMLLRWQTELLSINTVQLPAVQQLITNSTQLATSVERFSSVAEKLPGQISTERVEILKALESQEKDITELLTAGTQMSTSLNTTITTLDALMERFGIGEPSDEPPSTNSEPFRIQNYTQMAAQLETTALQLTELLITFDQTLGSTNLTNLSAQADPVVRQAQTGGKEVVDYAFFRGLLFVASVLVAALIYRFLTARLRPSKAR